MLGCYRLSGQIWLALALGVKGFRKNSCGLVTEDWQRPVQLALSENDCELDNAARWHRVLSHMN